MATTAAAATTTEQLLSYGNETSGKASDSWCLYGLKSNVPGNEAAAPTTAQFSGLQLQPFEQLAVAKAEAGPTRMGQAQLGQGYRMRRGGEAWCKCKKQTQ